MKIFEKKNWPSDFEVEGSGVDINFQKYLLQSYSYVNNSKKNYEFLSLFRCVIPKLEICKKPRTALFQ